MTRTVLLLTLLTTLILSGCQAMSGFGRDVQKLGSWIERHSN